MDVIEVKNGEINFDLYKERVLEGSSFIYPTDTIYGIGCDATNSEAVKKIRSLKNRDSKPFSVIVPSKEWILENCEINENVVKWVNKLPGPYTLVLNLKNINCVAGDVNCFGRSLGVRIPNHWFKDFVSNLGRPLVTTSVNLSGEMNMSSLDDLNKGIKEGVNFCFYEGEKKGSASTVVILITDEEKIIER